MPEAIIAPEWTCCRLAGLSAADLAAWRELAAGAVEPNPFFEPELALPAWRALGAGDVALLVERGEKQAGWDGCLPVAVERRVAGVPLVLGTWRHDYSLPRARRWSTAGATERFAAALALEASSRARARFLALRGCAEGEVFGSIRAALGRRARRRRLRDRPRAGRPRAPPAARLPRPHQVPPPPRDGTPAPPARRGAGRRGGGRRAHRGPRRRRRVPPPRGLRLEGSRGHRDGDQRAAQGFFRRSARPSRPSGGCSCWRWRAAAAPPR